jgi:hypothetical protein
MGDLFWHNTPGSSSCMTAKRHFDYIPRFFWFIFLFRFLAFPFLASLSAYSISFFKWLAASLAALSLFRRVLIHCPIINPIKQVSPKYTQVSKLFDNKIFPYNFTLCCQILEIVMEAVECGLNNHPFQMLLTFSTILGRISPVFPWMR